MGNEKKQAFGLPIVDNTPMGQVAMGGQLYRGMASFRPSSKMMRFFIILAALLVLIFPSVELFCVFLKTTFAETKNSGERVWMIFPILALILVFGAGVKIIFVQFKVLISKAVK